MVIDIKDTINSERFAQVHARAPEPPLEQTLDPSGVERLRYRGRAFVSATMTQPFGSRIRLPGRGGIT
jgi:hypothetical protein